MKTSMREHSMDSNEQIRHLLMQQLESLRASGVQTVPKGMAEIVLPEPIIVAGPTPEPAPVMTRPPQSSPIAKDLGGSSVEPTLPEVKSSSNHLESYPEAVESAQRQTSLEVIQSEVANCRACSELCNSRKQTVFGVGNPNARICFVGEGPGADEDRLGEPFVGAAGQLLDKIIGACNLSRQDVYILNTVKCRPPGNRNPNEVELDNCWPYAIRQLEVIQPEFICCLGSVAAKTLLKTKSSISKLRGQFHSYRDSQVVVTYHPAYLLRTPTAKKHTWNDMKMLMAAMGIDV